MPWIPDPEEDISDCLRSHLHANFDLAEMKDADQSERSSGGAVVPQRDGETERPRLAKGPRLEAEIRQQFGAAARLHESHSICITGQVKWCTKCGLYAIKCIRGLAKPCRGAPSKRGACNLSKLRKGLPPRNQQETQDCQEARQVVLDDMVGPPRVPRRQKQRRRPGWPVRTVTEAERAVSSTAAPDENRSDAEHEDLPEEVPAEDSQEEDVFGHGGDLD